MGLRVADERRNASRRPSSGPPSADTTENFDKVVIDPPMAAISWIVTGRFGEDALELVGSTIFEFDESVQIRRFWMYYNDPLA